MVVDIKIFHPEALLLINVRKIKKLNRSGWPYLIRQQKKKNLDFIYQKCIALLPSLYVHILRSRDLNNKMDSSQNYIPSK